MPTPKHRRTRDRVRRAEQQQQQQQQQQSPVHLNIRPMSPPAFSHHEVSLPAALFTMAFLISATMGIPLKTTTDGSDGTDPSTDSDSDESTDKPSMTNINPLAISPTIRRVPNSTSCLMQPANITMTDYNATFTTEELYSQYPGLIYYEKEFDVSYIQKINPYWLTFPPPSETSFLIMAYLYIIICVVGIIGNALVIILFIRFKSLRTAANYLVVNLAISDFLMLAKCPIAIYNNFMGGPALGDWGCRIYGFIGGLSGTASIGTLTAISLDRYSVIVHPLGPLRRRSKRRVKIIILCIWIYSFIFSIIPALDIGLSVYVPEGFLTTCSFDYLTPEIPARVFMILFFLSAWLFPLSAIARSYTLILRVVWSSKNIQSNVDKNQLERKVAIIVFWIVFIWFAAWTPYSAVAMAGVFGFKSIINPWVSMIPALFCKTAACIDPYLYAGTHPRFRVHLCSMLPNKLKFLIPPPERFSYRLSYRSSVRASTPSSRFRMTYENERRERNFELVKTAVSANAQLPVVQEEAEETSHITGEELQEVIVVPVTIETVPDVLETKF